MKKDQRGMVEKITNHIDYNISEKQIDDLTEFMRFDNYQKTSSMNKKAELQGKGKGRFIRKGIVGDWINHFQDKTVKEWDKMINQEFEKTGIQDKKILDLVKLQG